MERPYRVNFDDDAWQPASSTLAKLSRPAIENVPGNPLLQSMRLGAIPLLRDQLDDDEGTLSSEDANTDDDTDYGTDTSDDAGQHAPQTALSIHAHGLGEDTSALVRPQLKQIRQHVNPMIQQVHYTISRTQDWLPVIALSDSKDEGDPDLGGRGSPNDLSKQAAAADVPTKKPLVGSRGDQRNDTETGMEISAKLLEQIRLLQDRVKRKDIHIHNLESVVREMQSTIKSLGGTV